MAARTSLIELPASLARPAVGGPRARLLLGVDGGATKTLAAAFDLESGVVHLGHAGPSNPDAVGSEAALDALGQAVGEALRCAAAERADGAVLALAGTDTMPCQRGSRRFDPAGLSSQRRCRRLGCGDRASPGVAVIAGTGSNVFGVGAGGATWRAGGWGYLLGDEGSGFWVAVRRLRRRWRHATGRSGHLARRGGEAHFGVWPIEMLAAEIYTRPIDHAEIAGFAARVSDAADAGDEVAHRCSATVRASWQRGRSP